MTKDIIQTPFFDKNGIDAKKTYIHLQRLEKFKQYTRRNNNPIDEPLVKEKQSAKQIGLQKRKR